MKQKSFKNFKNKVIDLTDSYLKNINQGFFSDKQKNDIHSKPQDKLPKFKIQLLRNELDINDEGDGFKKHIMIQLLMQNLLKSENKLILIDEIENHFSIKTIQFVLNNLPENSQIIATSHRIEINNPKLNAITSIDNEIFEKIGTYISNEMSNKVIVVEGKNDLPIIGRVLEILKMDKQLTIVVGTSKEQAKTISVRYDCVSFIDKDDYENTNNQNNKIYYTKRRQNGKLLTSNFIDNDEKLKGITIGESTTIENMLNSCFHKFKTKIEMKNYIVGKVFFVNGQSKSIN